MQRGNIRKFGREKSQRKALMKSLATALIENGKIKTTEAKAKTLSGFMDELVIKALNNNINSRRGLSKNIGARVVGKLVNEVAPKFKDKKSGFTRIIRLGQRKSDSAPMVLIEFTFIKEPAAK